MAIKRADIYLQTKDATATAADIASAETAYVAGQKITGTLSFTNDACRVYNSSSQTINNASWTTLTFNSELFDNNTLHDTSTKPSRLTCKTAGVYFIGGNMEIDNNTNGDRFLRILHNNTTAIANVTTNSNSLPDTKMNVNAIYALSANDYVELQAYQNCGNPLDVYSTARYGADFWMCKISD